jgi:hypothetical protein
VLIQRTAQQAIEQVYRLWEDVRTRPAVPAEYGQALGWMETGEYLELAARSLKSRVLDRFGERGITVS